MKYPYFPLKRIFFEIFPTAFTQAVEGCRCTLQDFERQQDTGSFFGFEFFELHNYEINHCASCGEYLR